jgi:hypothetical protein
MFKITEIITAVKTVNEVKGFLKQQDEVKNKTLNFIERINGVRQSFLGMVKVLDETLGRLKSIVSGNKETLN